MSFLATLFKGGLFGTRHDDRDTVRELWHRVVAIAREKEWYRTCGVADTLAGRFDLITLVLSLVMLRMEREEALIPPSVWLTELFVEDMDAQLREQGVGDGDDPVAEVGAALGEHHKPGAHKQGCPHRGGGSQPLRRGGGGQHAGGTGAAKVQTSCFGGPASGQPRTLPRRDVSPHNGAALSAPGHGACECARPRAERPAGSC